MATTIISSAVAKDKYPRVVGMKTPNGSPIRDNGDEVAVALRGTGLEDWRHIADKNGCRENIDALEAAGKNTGQIRMALGRILRAKMARHNADPEKEAAPWLPEPKAVEAKPEPAADAPQKEQSADQE